MTSSRQGSRLGTPEPQAPSGAARFASKIGPAEKPADDTSATSASATVTPEVKTVKATKRQIEPAPVVTKQPVTIRLTSEAIEKLSELERSLRRSGVKARQGASASEVVELLITAADADDLVRKMKARSKQR